MPEDEPPVLAGGADDVDLVVVLAVVVGLLPPSKIISRVLVVGWKELYRCQVRIASSTRSEPCTCILRRKTWSRSNLVRHIVRMLDSELRRY